jgi:murein DD-endopeptidase MepM/ murein hydrolase activator NlpD
MKNKVLAMFLILTILSLGVKTYATTISDYQSQQKQTQDEKDKAKENLQSVTSEKNTVQEQVSSLNESISGVQADLSDLQDKIDELDKSVDNKQKELDEKQKLLEERLVASYMNGSTTYMDALFSGGISNFISNYETIKQIAEYDNNLIGEVKQTKTSLENDKTDLENSKEQVQQKETQLKTEKAEREEKVKSLSVEEQAAQAEIEQKENELAKINAAVKAEQKKIDETEKKQRALEAAKAAAAKNNNKKNNTNKNNNTNNNTNKNNNTNNVSPSTSGSMSWPTRITHKVNSVYAPRGRSDTSGYTGTAHKGLDIYAPARTPVYAAKAGTVVYVNYSGYGGGWGLYVVIYHGTDSSGKAMYTRYAHASSIASGISVGTKVTTNTVIMYSGNTGASEGAHLHFEVCLGSMYSQVNPAPYLGVANARGTY